MAGSKRLLFVEFILGRKNPSLLSAGALSVTHGHCMYGPLSTLGGLTNMTQRTRDRIFGDFGYVELASLIVTLVLLFVAAALIIFGPI